MTSTVEADRDTTPSDEAGSRRPGRLAPIARAARGTGRAVRGAGRGAGRAVAAVRRGLAALVRTPRRVTITLAVVAVILAAALAALVWATRHHTQSEAAGQEAQRVAGQQVVAMLSYDFHTARRDLPGVLNSLTGPFHDQYAQLLNDKVIPTAEQQQVSTRTSLVSSSIVTAAPDHVELLMFLNQTSVSPALPQPALEGSRARVDLDLVDGQWKISALNPV